jgi:hypothetical protein
MVVKAPRELLDMERGSYIDDVDENSSFGEDDEHLSGEQAINYVIRSGNDKSRVNERAVLDKAQDDEDEEEGQVGGVCLSESVVAFKNTGLS